VLSANESGNTIDLRVGDGTGAVDVRVFVEDGDVSPLSGFFVCVSHVFCLLLALRT
jgi:hypothetical protein